MALNTLLPSAIRNIMQSGLLFAAFEDALLPEFLFPMVATPRPWMAGLGDTVTFTRPGLMTPQILPITGSDPSPDSYGVEQYSMTMDQYGNSVDTNMLASSATLASKFLLDQQRLGINAGQSLNRLVRSKLFNAYLGGRAFVTTAQATAGTSQPVDSVLGFEHVMVNGRLVPVSPTNPLSITINGVANTVVGAARGTETNLTREEVRVPGTLTLGTAVVTAVGQAVISAQAPVSLRPAGRATANDLAAADVATFALFADAVARLRRQNVPSFGGYYVAHIDPITERQLFTDSSFISSLQSGVPSPIFGSLSLGRFAGIDWVRNNETPSRALNGREVHRAIIMGADCLLAGPYLDMGNLLAEIGNTPIGSIEMMPAGVGMEVAHIVRGPQDRLQQVISSSWSWIGDFAAPTDSTTGDSAIYKRAVVIEHS
ncbi:MAG: hypothetical protein M3P49_09645 [Actinomycetota bacterium]|nr:hypothetical protein [Actinomycetota bacterium]